MVSQEYSTRLDAPSIENANVSSAGLLANDIPVFIYGTFKPSFPRHKYITRQRLEEARTQKAFDLVMLEDQFPGLVEGNKSVEGYVVYVDTYTLYIMDRIEGVDYSLYKREKIKLEDGAEVWSYFVNLAEFEAVRATISEEHVQLYRDAYNVSYVHRLRHDHSAPG